MSIYLSKTVAIYLSAIAAFGFLANCSQKDRNAYWEQYKIDIVPYSANDNDHSDLLNVLNAYRAFVLDRSSRFNQVITSTPDYDIETVGLHYQKRLCRGGWTPDSSAVDCIVKGLILAQLKVKSPQTIDEIAVATSKNSGYMKKEIARVVKALITDGNLIENKGQISLSSKGSDIASHGKADYELARDQFLRSIQSRIRIQFSDMVIVQNVCDVAVRYLERMCKERGLGVAQQLAETGNVENRARAVALMQGAKLELQYAKDKDAAFAVIRCIWDVLSEPRPEEKRYLGLLTQAYFGRQLLNIDPAAIGIQRTNLSSTVFIADSNFIIPLIAEGSIGHEYALTLYTKLNSFNCQVVTSDYLLEYNGPQNLDSMLSYTWE